MLSWVYEHDLLASVGSCDGGCMPARSNSRKVSLDSKTALYSLSCSCSTFRQCLSPVILFVPHIVAVIQSLCPPSSLHRSIE